MADSPYVFNPCFDEGSKQSKAQDEQSGRMLLPGMLVTGLNDSTQSHNGEKMYVKRLLLPLVAVTLLAICGWQAVTAADEVGYTTYPNFELEQNWGYKPQVGRKRTIISVTAQVTDMVVWQTERWVNWIIQGQRTFEAGVTHSKEYVNDGWPSYDDLVEYELASDQNATNFLETNWDRNECPRGPEVAIRTADGVTEFEVKNTLGASISFGNIYYQDFILQLAPGMSGTIQTDRVVGEMALSETRSEPGIYFPCFTAEWNLYHSLATKTVVNGPAVVTPGEVVEVTVELTNASSQTVVFDKNFNQGSVPELGWIAHELTPTVTTGHASGCSGGCPIRWRGTVHAGQTETMIVQMLLKSDLPDGEILLALFEGLNGKTATTQTTVAVPTAITLTNHSAETRFSWLQVGIGVAILLVGAWFHVRRGSK